jgi:hypothetical protein
MGNVAIPLLIGIHFCRPVFAIAPWQPKAGGITVPKVSVHKNDHPMTWENKIGFPEQTTTAPPALYPIPTHDAY